MKYEVRCCCDPNRILSWIETDLRPDPDGNLVLPQQTDREYLKPLEITVRLHPGQTLVYNSYERYHQTMRFTAIPSYDLPIEFWRSIQQFVEKNPPRKENSHDDSV